MLPESPEELFREIRDAEPDPAHMMSIQHALAGSKRSVRPLPSDAALAAVLVGAFLLIALAAALPVGYAGFDALSIAQKLVMYGSLLLSAGILGLAVIEQMVPGARRRVPVALAIAFPILAMAFIVPFLFPDFSTRNFVRQGVPCLRLGLLCAIPSGALAGLFLRRGFLTSPIAAAVAAGGLSGLVGLAVLALHCPIQNAAHVLAWHLGVVAVSVLGGGALGWAALRFR